MANCRSVLSGSTAVPGPGSPSKGLRCLFFIAEWIPAFALLNPVVPAGASPGTEGAAFLQIPVGAEPAAMGSAYTARSEDAYAPVWNPAGLGFLQGPEIAGQHLAYLDTLHYEFLSFAYPLNKGSSVGVSIQYLGANDFVGVDRNQAPTGNFGSYYAAYSLAYGRKMRYAPLAVGVTAKVIQAKLGDVSAHAYAVDAGLSYHAGEKCVLAAVLSNLGTPLTFLSDGDSLPLTGKVGIAYHPSRFWVTTFDAASARSGQTDLRAGTEWNAWGGFSLRAGYRTDNLKGLSPLAGVTAGMGLSMLGQDFSYAWVPYGDLGNTHYFSILLRFGEAQNRWNFVRSAQRVRLTTPGEYPYGEYDHAEYAAQLNELLNSETPRKAAVSMLTTESLK